MGGDQIPHALIDQDWKMRKWSFRQWSWGFKCFHCNKMIEWSLREAKKHFLSLHKMENGE